jgi:hypothetical protein
MTVDEQKQKGTEGNRLDEGEGTGKLARAEGQRFNCAPWVHKTRSMAREDFTREVNRELTGRETEPHEIIYFRLYKSQIPVIKQALETPSSDARYR